MVSYIPLPCREIASAGREQEVALEWPAMAPMRQRFEDEAVDDLDGVISRGVRARLAQARPAPGASVAIGVGSRGVSPILQVVSVVVRELKDAGLRPFVVPAMGSHGGGTAEGQRRVLTEYGISEEQIGAPVRATMETKLLGTTPQGVEVHGDANAFGADHVAIIGRVKPHTAFRAEIESGLCKMLTVGLGKRKGAERIHEGGLAETIPAAAEVVLATGKVLFGLALVENAFDRPHTVRVAAPDDFLRTDRELLVLAKKLLPKLPMDHLHLLVVDEMGKNISGTGMDTNVVGMWRRIGGERSPDYGSLVVLRLTAESEGNASGVGMADFVTNALVDAIDREKTYVNALTALVPFMVRIPLTLRTDRDCLGTAIEFARRSAGGGLRMARIKNTLEIERFWVTENVAAELEAGRFAERDGAPKRMEFDAAGNLAGVAA